MNPHREQLERLLSDRLDGVLDAEQQAELERLLAADAEGAEAVDQYARLDALLQQWRAVQPDVDWQTVRERIRAAIDETDDAAWTVADAKLDDILAQWAGPVPAVDWDRLRSRYSEAVRREAERDALLEPVGGGAVHRRLQWTLRVGLPLAAAAAIALAVWLPREINPLQPEPAKPMVLVSLDTPATQGSVEFAFDEQPARPSPDAPQAENGGVMAIAIGPGTEDEPADDDIDPIIYY